MSLSTIANPTSETQQSCIRIVYEYSLTVCDREDNDIQKLTAAFYHLPSLQDWQHWLSGWFDCGYSLSSPPILVRTI